jgi:hypothetical protein
MAPADELRSAFHHQMRVVDAGTFFLEMMTQRRTVASILTPYLPYLQQRWAAGQHNGSQLFRDISTQGYRGSQSMLALWAATQRRNDPTGSVNLVDITYT